MGRDCRRGLRRWMSSCLCSREILLFGLMGAGVSPLRCGHLPPGTRARIGCRGDWRRCAIITRGPSGCRRRSFPAPRSSPANGAHKLPVATPCVVIDRDRRVYLLGNAERGSPPKDEYIFNHGKHGKHGKNAEMLEQAGVDYGTLRSDSRQTIPTQRASEGAQTEGQGPAVHPARPRPASPRLRGLMRCF